MNLSVNLNKVLNKGHYLGWDLKKQQLKTFYSKYWIDINH